MQISDLNFDYGSEDSTIFRRVNLEFSAGEFSIIAGPTGSGKSTLLKVMNKLAPTFSGGRFSGSLRIDEIEFENARPKDLARRIGYVNQTPESSFVAETVIEELAFGMEQLGIDRAEMQQNIAKYSQLFGLQELLQSSLNNLSAGEQQRVAITAALVAGQKVLLLDEPTSALDSDAAQKLVVALRELSTKNGTTVIITEHRLENLVDLADSVVLLKGDGSAQKKDASWENIYSTFPSWRSTEPKAANQLKPEQAIGQVLKSAELTVQYPGAQNLSLNKASIEIKPKEIVALVGPNGSGKTTLLDALAGQVKFSGSISFGENNLANKKQQEINKVIALVPQCASDLLFLSTVSQELSESDAYAAVTQNTTSGIFSKLVGRINPAIHPRDLSVGQQLALVISLQLALGAPILALDEPTRGLDYEAKAELANLLIRVRDSGKSVLLATHDLEFANQIANRLVHLNFGKISEDGETAS